MRMTIALSLLLTCSCGATMVVDAQAPPGINAEYR
jgi:hypothetical protein